MPLTDAIEGIGLIAGSALRSRAVRAEGLSCVLVDDSYDQRVRPIEACVGAARRRCSNVVPGQLREAAHACCSMISLTADASRRHRRFGA